MNRPVRFVFALAAAAIVAVVPAAAETWKIDTSHSSSQFSVTHMMITTVRGSFGATSGTIEYDGKSVASIKADVTIDAATINTNNEKRDGHLKSPDFFDVATYPTLTFKSTKVVPGSDGGFKLVGNLTMRGVTKEVTLDVAPLSPIMKGKRGDRVGASATTTINRQDFGVKWNNPLEGGGVVVSDNVKVTLDIEAILPAPEGATPPPPPPPPPAK